MTIAQKAVRRASGIWASPENRARWLWQFLMAWGLATMAQVQLMEIDWFFVKLCVMLFVLFESAYLLQRNRLVRAGRAAWPALVGLLLLSAWHVFTQLFGDVSLSAVLFHFQHPVESNGVVSEVAGQAALAAAPCVLLIAAWWRLSPKTAWMRSRLVPVLLLVANPFLWAVTSHAVDAASAPPMALSDQYRDPALAVAPPAGNRKNLIHIYLESAERTLYDESVFSHVARPLKTLEARGFSATGIGQAEMTGWTLAGQVSSLCGTPLFSLGVFQRNNFDDLGAFLPGAACLQDILKRDGYATGYIKGASLEFAGTSGFVGAHGFDRRLGLDELDAGYPGERTVWGLHDEQMFAAAFDEVQRLRAAGGPYSITLTTIGGHTPHGFLSPVCRKDEGIMALPNGTLRGFACTNRLTAEFVDRLQQAGFLDDSIVVIQSDHLAMRNDMTAALEARDRRNLFFILGDGIGARQQLKPAAMFDAYPTILAALGYSLPDGRAGLGVSLFSDATTLTGRLGPRDLDRSILADEALRNRLWNLGS